MITSLSAIVSAPEVRGLTLSAQPGAPVVIETQPVPLRRCRTVLVAFLRRSAQRRAQLADRFDPARTRLRPA